MYIFCFSFLLNLCNRAATVSLCRDEPTDKTPYYLHRYDRMVILKQRAFVQDYLLQSWHISAHINLISIKKSFLKRISGKKTRNKKRNISGHVLDSAWFLSILLYSHKCLFVVCELISMTYFLCSFLRLCIYPMVCH